MRFCRRRSSSAVMGVKERPYLAHIAWKAWSHAVTAPGTSRSVMARNVTMRRYCQSRPRDVAERPLHFRSSRRPRGARFVRVGANDPTDIDDHLGAAPRRLPYEPPQSQARLRRRRIRTVNMLMRMTAQPTSSAPAVYRWRSNMTI